MESSQRDANRTEASVETRDAYEPPMLVSIGRVEDLTRGLKGKGGDALIQKSV